MVAITVTTLTMDPTKSSRRGPQSAKRGIRGAAGGTYIGPVRPNSTSHATGSGAGGVEDSTGFRESDNYQNDGGTGGGIGMVAGNTITRPSGGGSSASKANAFLGDGVQGGSAQSSTAGAKVIDPTGRAIDAGVDRFGRSLAGVAYSSGLGAGRYTYTNYDGRSNLDGDGGVALGSSGRGTTATGTGPADTVTGETVARRVAFLVRPTISNAADPGATGTVSIVGGAGKIQVDLHADDITGGASGMAGCEVTIFKRGTDTDEDGALVAAFTADGGTDITDAVTGLTAATYACYVRYRQVTKSRFSKSFYGSGSGQLGPCSARGTVVVT